jgi:hypothetical protein
MALPMGFWDKKINDLGRQWSVMPLTWVVDFVNRLIIFQIIELLELELFRGQIWGEMFLKPFWTSVVKVTA